VSVATAEKIVAARSLALVGNPNVGKSVIFSGLTGKYVTVSNYPGTTVDVSRGAGSFAGAQYHVVDTPGVNSLIPHSEDERVARDVLLRDAPDVVVQVLDAKNLRRGLMLTLELAEYGRPMVLVLNMTDEALDRGISIDADRLSRLLGVPVVETVAVTGQGLSDLKRAVSRAAVPSMAVPFPAELARSLDALRGFWREDYAPWRAVALALLSGDDSALTWAHAGFSRDASEPAVHAAAAAQKAAFVRSPRMVIFESRESWILRTLGEVMAVEGRLSAGWAAKLGRWAMRPWPGYAIAAGVLYLMYQFVGVFGAGTAVDFLENTVFGGYLVPAAEKLVVTFVPSTFIQEMLVGPYGAVSMALTYALALILPIVTTFFLAFGLLEDSGYLPRLAVMLDRVFRLMGLNGKAVLPMVLGLGCDTMATVTTRILDTRKERLIVTLLLSLSVPCSAQMAVIFAMIAGMSVKVLALWTAVTLGATLAVGWLSARLLPGARSAFLMEIPPIRRPLFRNIFLKTKGRLVWYLKEVVPMFIWGTLILFALDKLGWLRGLEKLSAPVVQKFLGLPVESTQAFIIGFLRRDYGAAGLYKLQQEGLMSNHQVVVSLVLITLFMPCIAQWMMVVKERGWRTALGVTAFVMAAALAIAGGVHRLLNVFPGLIK
jgi:ferrous iron transport protein B